MKNTIITLILALSIFSVSAVNQQPKPQQWEYKFDYKCYEKGANELAAQGWELIAADTNTYSNTITQMCIFRRAK